MDSAGAIFEGGLDELVVDFVLQRQGSFRRREPLAEELAHRLLEVAKTLTLVDGQLVRLAGDSPQHDVYAAYEDNPRLDRTIFGAISERA